jgi:hypothetical protein
MLEHALEYVRRGWAVLPLHDVTEGACSCQESCLSPGKHPRLRNGLNGASKNEGVVMHWWATWPNANIGIRTGRESGIVVLDLDIQKPGVAPALTTWLAANGGTWGQPLTVRTGSGGLHLYYAYPKGYPEHLTIKTVKAVCGVAGLDVRADGGYVVAPPSRNLNGLYSFA